MQTNLHKTVMRRVYYSFALSFLSEKMLWQGVALGACIALFGRLTHVAAIARNLEGTRIGDAPQFILSSFMHALTHGEVLTALVAFFMLTLTAVFVVRTIPMFFHTSTYKAA